MNLAEGPTSSTKASSSASASVPTSCASGSTQNPEIAQTPLPTHPPLLATTKDPDFSSLRDVLSGMFSRTSFTYTDLQLCNELSALQDMVTAHVGKVAVKAHKAAIAQAAEWKEAAERLQKQYETVTGERNELKRALASKEKELKDVTAEFDSKKRHWGSIEGLLEEVEAKRKQRDTQQEARP